MQFTSNFLTFFTVLTVYVTLCTTQNAPATSGSSSTSSSQIKCFACGLEEIDPEIDEKDSYGDSRRDGVPKTKKMYNHTCDIAAEMGFDDRWARNCPAGVRSCFWAEARYDRQGKRFTKIKN